MLAIGGLIFICIIVIPGFWLARRSRAALEPGILSAQVDKLASRWNADNAPSSDRVVNLIVSDAEGAAAAANRPAEKTSAYSSEDLEVLASAQKPPFMARVAAWFRRTFFRRSMKAPENTAFTESLADKPGAVVWTHKGEESASEEEMTREFMRAILKADASGAEINIITDGPAAVAALKTVKILKGVKRPDGRIPAVSKVIAVNMNPATLERMSPDSFDNYSKPDNLRELVFIWNPPAASKKTTIELFSSKNDRKRFDGAELFQMMGGGGTGAENTSRLIEVMARKIYTMEQVIWHLAAKAEAKKQPETAPEAGAKKTWTAPAVSRDLNGRTYRKEAAQPADSLSAVGGGWLKEESAKAARAPAARASGECPTDVTAWRRIGKADNCRKGYCNWYDAMMYCNGQLPTVKQLQEVYRSKCGGAGGAACGELYWSSDRYEDDPCNIQGANFGAGGTACKMARINGGGHVICR